MIYEVKGTPAVARLFEGWQETMIWSCLQGRMGRLYADSEAAPQAAMALLGDFCFFAGSPTPALAAHKPDGCKKDFIIMTAKTPDWFPLIEAIYQKRAKRITRYALKKEANAFDPKKLQCLAQSARPDIELRMMDESLYHVCKEQPWSRDLVALFSEYEAYRQAGLGVVALKNGLLVSGASSYSSYQGGIEIEIDTRKEYRRQGLATACGARLILACLARGIYPSWDAQNLPSVALAEKLGYHLDRPYTAYEIHGY